MGMRFIRLNAAQTCARTRLRQGLRSGLFLLMLLLCTTGYGFQQWVRSFGTASDDWANDVQPTTDRAYIVTGGAGDRLWLVKCDSTGDTLWTRRYRPADAENACGWSVVSSPQGGYLAAGTAQLDEDLLREGDRMYVLATDENGDSLWSSTYGSDSTPAGACDVIGTRDGGYLLAGYQDLSGSCRSLAALVKFDGAGNQLWARTYGQNPNPMAIAYSVTELADGGFILAGSTYGSVCDGVLMRTDSAGNQIWMRSYGAMAQEMFKNAYPVSGGFVAIGWSDSYGAGFGDGWLIRTDTTGRRLWSRTYGGCAFDALGGAPTRDGGFILAGQTFSFGAGGGDAWVVRVDSGGDEEWSRTFGGTGYDFATAAWETEDSGYVIAGACSDSATGQNVLLIKSDRSGCAAITETRESEHRAARPAEPHLQFSQNPVSDLRRALTVRFCMAEPGTAELASFNRLGRREATLFSGTLAAGWHEVAIPTGLTLGAHFLRLATRQGAVTGKLVVVGRD
jgi:hypothetical protein